MTSRQSALPEPQTSLPLTVFSTRAEPLGRQTDRQTDQQSIALKRRIEAKH